MMVAQLTRHMYIHAYVLGKKKKTLDLKRLSSVWGKKTPTRLSLMPTLSGPSRLYVVSEVTADVGWWMIVVVLGMQ